MPDVPSGLPQHALNLYLDGLDSHSLADLFRGLHLTRTKEFASFGRESNSALCVDEAIAGRSGHTASHGRSRSGKESKDGDGELH